MRIRQNATTKLKSSFFEVKVGVAVVFGPCAFLEFRKLFQDFDYRITCSYVLYVLAVRVVLCMRALVSNSRFGFCAHARSFWFVLAHKAVVMKLIHPYIGNACARHDLLWTFLRLFCKVPVGTNLYTCISTCTQRTYTYLCVCI